MRCAYRFVLEVRTADGSRVLVREALRPDWEPALEAGRLTGLRAHGVWHQPGDGEPVVVPMWHQRGEPVVRAVRVCLTGGGHEWHADIPSAAYFSDAARAVIAARVAAGTLDAGERVRYGVAAYLEPVPASAPPLSFTTQPRPQPIRVRDRGFAALVAGSMECGDHDASDIEVVVPDAVLEEMCVLTREAGERETGGILLGHLCRVTGGDVGVEVTAHVAARHTVGDAVKLTFTSDTWTDVRAAVALRNAGELLVGWWHSHPAHAWCKACPLERQRVCQLSTGFLSTEDRALHRAMFASAFTQALVVTHSAAGLETKLFGWRRGALQPRGFRLLDSHTGHAMARASVQQTAAVTEAACDKDDRLQAPGSGLQEDRPQAPGAGLQEKKEVHV